MTGDPQNPLADALRNLLTPIVHRAISDALEGSRPTEPGKPEPALLTAVQLCSKLQISRQTLNRLQHEGLPRVLVGDAPRYALTDVLAWLGSRAQK